MDLCYYFVLNFDVIQGHIFETLAWARQVIKPEVPQSPDARLLKAFVVRGFISMISKVKMQKKNTETLKFLDFNICPNILHADADAGVIAIALLH